MFTINDLRKNLIKERNKRNMSAYDLSLRLGKDKGYISDIENRSYPSIKTLLEICAILEIEPEVLFQKNSNKKK